MTELTTSERSFVGASFEPQSELPMIVWLRGDESYLDDFCIDAEAAMKALGIKRSRLTQISGRELRVGRLRVDRYTRPMYRIEDIESYKSWTRATASHLKSSNAIQEAADKLGEHSQHLSEKLHAQLEATLGETQNSLDGLREEIRKHHQNYTEQSRSLLEHQKHEFFRHLDQNSENIKIQFQHLESVMLRLAETQSLLVPLTHQMDELKLQVRSLDDQARSREDGEVQRSLDLMKQLTLMQQSDRDLGKALSLLVQLQRDGLRRHEELKEQLLHRNDTEETVTEIRPTRRVPYAARRRYARKMIG